MTTPWTINATAERVALDPQGRAETAFTVTNFGPVDRRLVVDVVPGERTDRAWFAVLEPQRVGQHGGSVSATSDADGDLYFEWISDSERYLTPTDGATFAKLDRASAGASAGAFAGAFAGASGSAQDAAQACAAAATTADRTPVGELGAGDLLCVRTGEGRLSVLTIFEPVGPSPTQLRATATT